MPRYFFDTSDGSFFCRDSEGVLLDDDVSARDAALEVLSDMAREVLPDSDRRTFLSTARDADGRRIYTATLTLVGGWIREDDQGA